MAQHTRIKICGLRDEQTIKKMDHLPIAQVGLVFAPSKRQVSFELGQKLVQAIHSITGFNGISPQAVGVFVNHSLDDLVFQLENLSLNVVQLHGQESVEYCRAIKEKFPLLNIWKVISVHNTVEVSEQLHRDLVTKLKPFQPWIEAVLIDAPGGGTGKPFNWEAIDLYRKATNELQLSLYVAGGLNESNVNELLTHYGTIDGIDVSSGVETDGVKDIEKIKDFVGKVIQA